MGSIVSLQVDGGPIGTLLDTGKGRQLAGSETVNILLWKEEMPVIGQSTVGLQALGKIAREVVVA